MSVGSSRGGETTEDREANDGTTADVPRATRSGDDAGTSTSSSSAPPGPNAPSTTRRTLTFPTSETRPTQPVPSRTVDERPIYLTESDDPEAANALKATLAQLRDSERALNTAGVPKDLIPTQELLPLLANSHLDSDSDSDSWDDNDAPDERPSERSTVPTLSKSKGVLALESSNPVIEPVSALAPAPAPPPLRIPALGVQSSVKEVELSASELQSDPGSAVTPPQPPVVRPRRDRLASTMPPPLPAQWKWRREVSLHTLLRGQSGASRSEVLELELEDDGETSYPIELSRVSRPAQSELDHNHDHNHNPNTINPATGTTARPPQDGADSVRGSKLSTRLSKLSRVFDPVGPRRALPLILSHLVLAATVGLIAGSARTPSSAIAKERREARAASSERTPLVSPASEAMPFPLSGSCTTSGASRILASRAQIGPGLEVSVLETGFGVALASGAMEAVGLRVEGTSGLRVAETVRVKHPMLVNHVTVDGHDDDADGIDVRVDSDEARTVVGAGDAPPYRVVARGGYVMALLDDPRGARIRTLWPVPGAKVYAPVIASPPPAAPAAPGAAAPSPYRPPGFSKLPDTPRPPIHAPAFATEIVRAAGRDDGGAVVAIRRPSMFWLGVTDGALAPAGALVALTRKGATVGTPALTQWGGGGAVAWAERAAGEREWNIVVAGFTPDGESGATHLGPVRVIAKGMSPSLATLPDGDLLLALADGAPGAHRVVALRLNRELEPRGEPVIVSPESVNAGQPVAAVRADGRGIVAFFAASIGRSASVFATPLACDPGL